ncbi:hypothetical protein Acsp06_08110 [Actinomycetospora sp. NBRC 106375]|nr:hypothetical protein Acsp06_08110 [Actinomycetospora sp. NBRC 106375]
MSFGRAADRGSRGGRVVADHTLRGGGGVGPGLVELTRGETTRAHAEGPGPLLHLAEGGAGAGG